MWFERPFTFQLGPHLLRGRVDRVDRLPGGDYELIDYKTGRPKTAAQLPDDVQLSLYAVGAREAWSLDASQQAYYYLLDDQKVHRAARRRRPQRVDPRGRGRGRRGDPLAGLRADAVVGGLLDLRLPARVPGRRAVGAYGRPGGSSGRAGAGSAGGRGRSSHPRGAGRGPRRPRSRPPARAARRTPARRGRSGPRC